MNRIHKTKFNPVLGQVIVCSEISKGRCKASGKVLSVMLAGVLSSGLALAQEAPTTSNPPPAAAPNAMTSARAADWTVENIALSTTANQVLVLSDEQAKANKHYKHDADITKNDLKLSGGAQLIYTGGSTDSADPKATLSFNNVTLTLTEDDEATLNSTANPIRSVSAVQAAFGSAIAFKNLSITTNGTAIVQKQGQDNTVLNNTFDGIYAGALHKSEQSKDLNNEIWVNGNYTFTFKRPITEAQAQDESLYGRASANALVAIPNIDPEHKGPDAAVTITGKMTATIENIEGNGVIVRGGKTADNHTPVVTLNHTTIKLKTSRGFALSVGAQPIPTGPISPTLFPDGYGAGELRFSKNAKVDINTAYQHHQDEAIHMAHGGSTLDASQAHSFKVRSQKAAVQLGGYALTLPEEYSTMVATLTQQPANTQFEVIHQYSTLDKNKHGGNVVAHIRNADIAAPVGFTDASVPGQATLLMRHIQLNPNDKAIFNFTTSSKTAIYGHENAPVAFVEQGEGELNLSGIKGNANSATLYGGVAQGLVATVDFTKVSTPEKMAQYVFGNLDVNLTDATWSLAQAQNTAGKLVANQVKHASARHVNLRDAVLVAHSENPDTTRAYDNNFSLTLQNRAEKTSDTADIPPAPLGNFTMANSTIDLSQNAKTNDVFSLHANYAATGNSVLKVNTDWRAPGGEQGENSTSDTLRITGTVTGSTRVMAIDADGTEKISGNVVLIDGKTLRSADVIIAPEATDASAFIGTGRTDGIAKLQLTSDIRDNTSDGTKNRHFYWSTGIRLAPDQAPIFALDETVVTLAGVAHHQQAYALDSLEQLHVRRGLRVQQGQNTWGRLLLKSDQQAGANRLLQDNRRYGVQLGLVFHESDNREHSTGAYFTHLRGYTKTYDRYSSDNGVLVGLQQQGGAHTQYNALGLNHLLRKGQGYVDLVAQYAWINNSYQFANHSTREQLGYGLTGSIEAGYNVALGQWVLAPQAQLVLNHTRLRGFNDGTRTVHDYRDNRFSTRLGLKVTGDTAPVYAALNLWQHFGQAPALRVGQDSLGERYSNTQLQGVIGVDLAIHRQLRAFAHISATYGLNRGTRQLGTNGSLGVKYQW